MMIFNEFSKKFLRKLDSYDEYLEKAKLNCQEIQTQIKEFDKEDHIYSMEDTKEELGLDDDLIETLLEDYVKQIISTIPHFKVLVKQIKKDISENKVPNFQPLRDLAHKNLGVARNLRIKDAQKILNSIMKEYDADIIEKYIDYLESCAILLKPKVAYEVYSS